MNTDSRKQPTPEKTASTHSLLSTFAWFLLAATATGLSAESTSTGTEDDVKEAVFRHQLRGCTTNVIHFLSVSEQEEKEDPSDDFLKRFADLGVPIKKASQAKRKMDGEYMVLCVDKETGKPGRLYRVHSVQFFAHSKALVKGMLWTGLEPAFGITNYTYIAVKQKDSWIVMDDTAAKRR
jgi:hypothetical protein